MFRLVWNFDKPYYSPSESAKINLWAVNDGNRDIYVSEVAVEFDFGIYPLPETVCGIISPPNSSSPNPVFLGYVDLRLPSTIVGARKFNVRYRIYHYENGQWIPHPTRLSKKFILNIFKTPIYRVFLSRGTHFEDRIVGDSIAQMVRESGLYPVTVGIDIPAPDSVTNEIIDSEIQNSAGLIAIATPRILDQATQTYKTLEWLHSETGLAYARRKPIMILKDRNVKLGGLASFLNPYTQLEFDPTNLYELKNRLALAVPWFRESIEKKNTEDFYRNLKDLALGGLAAFGGAVLLIGIIGSLFEE